MDGNKGINMADRRSRKMSTIIFLFAIFILLVVVTGSWISSMYREQTRYSEASTLSAVECGRYYFRIAPETVSYQNGTLYFEIKNTLGSDIETLVVESWQGSQEIDIRLTSDTIMPVSLEIDVAEWVTVYPKGCRGLNFKNLSFEPNTPETEG